MTEIIGSYPPHELHSGIAAHADIASVAKIPDDHNLTGAARPFDAVVIRANYEGRLLLRSCAGAFGFGAVRLSDIASIQAPTSFDRQRLFFATCIGRETCRP